MIETLPSGRGIVFGLTPQPMIVQFDRKLSRDLSQTPKLSRLRQPRRALELAPLPPRKKASVETLEFMEEETDALFDELMHRPDIDADDSRYGDETGGFPGLPTNSEETHSELNLSGSPDVRDSRQSPPETDENEPVASAGGIPDAFQPGEDDLLLSGVQPDLFLLFYSNPESPSYGNIAKSLEQIKNDKGQGLGKRYSRHASWILEQRGLKKVKRA